MSKDQLEEWDETAANNTDIGGTSLVDSVATIDTLDTIFNELMAQTAKWLGADTLASATTTDLGSVPGRYVSVTGTTTITGFGTIKDGTIKIVKFGGILTLTHNGTSLILPGAANITTAAGDVALMGSEGSGNWRCLSYQRASGLGLASVVDDTSPQLGGDLDVNSNGIAFSGATVTDVTGADTTLVSGTAGTSGNLAQWNGDGDVVDAGAAVSDVDPRGQQTIWVPAGAMTPTTTNGAAATTEELATNDIMLSYLAYDDSTQEHACFAIQMPKGWNESTLVCQFVWKCGATTGNVIWGIQAGALANDDALDAALGTAQEVTDAAGTAADDCMISSETSAMTVAGSPGAEEYVVFKVYRKAADGSDTLSGDAELLGVKIHYSTNAATDD